MATNLYFNNYNDTPEQRLMEDLMIETIKINGVDCYYIPNINESARDLIYGEDPLKKFTAAYPLEMYVTNVDGYEGEREFFSKFGLEIRNNMSVIISKRSFARWVPQNRYVRPREGDLIYVPFLSQSGEMYEIKYVNYSEAFYVLGNKYPYFYKLELEKFKYSQETIDVGIPDVDNVVVQDAYNVTLRVTANSASNNFIVGEYVSANTTGVSGTVTYWDRPSGTLKVTDLLGTFANNQLLRGNTSGARFVVSNAIDPLTDPQEREMYDNFTIQTEADNYVDLSENNPFGLPS
jgi:hypothetical protein